MADTHIYIILQILEVEFLPSTTVIFLNKYIMASSNH